nr:hypothetical protein [Nocardia vaccinii]
MGVFDGDLSARILRRGGGVGTGQDGQVSLAGQALEFDGNDVGDEQPMRILDSEPDPGAGAVLQSDVDDLADLYTPHAHVGVGA